MYKVLVLQTHYSLSDNLAEFQVRDRLSFMRFLGLEPEHPNCSPRQPIFRTISARCAFASMRSTFERRALRIAKSNPDRHVPTHVSKLPIAQTRTGITRMPNRLESLETGHKPILIAPRKGMGALPAAAIYCREGGQ
jgi:hypothetical protein